MFVRPVLTMDPHVAAFDFFGRAPHRLVPDNPKTRVWRHQDYGSRG
jgi:transposase